MTDSINKKYLLPPDNFDQHDVGLSYKSEL